MTARASTSKAVNISKLSIKEVAANIRTIKITIESCENLRPFFPVADIRAKCIFGEVILGESQPVPITDAQIIPIGYTFEIEVDQDSTRDMDVLVTYPAFLYFDQIQGTLDRDLYPQLQVNDLIYSVLPVKSFDSIISLYEALAVSKSDSMGTFNGSTSGSKKKKPSNKGIGTIRSSISKERSKTKISDSKTTIVKEKKSAANSKSTISEKRNSRGSVRQSTSSGNELRYEPTPFGMCVIDFLPLIFGKKSITQSMLIKPLVQYTDERMNSFKAHPKATVSLFIDGDNTFDITNPMLLNFTAESLYNIPSSVMTTGEQDYKLCCMMPMLGGQKMPMVFSNPVTLYESSDGISKCWPGIQRVTTEANTTTYRTPDDLKDINSKFNPNIEAYINAESCRLQYTMIKRHLLLKDSLDDIAAHVKLYRKIVLEFYMENKKRSSLKNTPGDAAKAFETLAAQKHLVKPTGPYLHLMALLDISTLLYPGVSRVRVAAPLTTFNMEEAMRHGGLDESFFIPNLAAKAGKPRTRDAESEKSESAAKEEKASKEDQNLKFKLPHRPEDKPDPLQVYDDEGRPCFVVVEIELTSPLIPPKDIEDLTEDLSKLIIDKNYIPNTLSKVILTSCITVDYFKEVLNGMVNDMNRQYIRFLENKKPPALTEGGEKALANFVDHLKKSGTYESYVNSISKVVKMLVSKKYQLNDTANNLQYQKLVGDIFVYLISQMNETVNKLICHGMEPVSNVLNYSKHLFFAREALETGRNDMAERYLLEKICNETDNADCWFNYAIFLLQNKEKEKAFECIKEALNKQMDHKYSLLALGVLLSSKGRSEDAETCFLNLMEKEYSWMEDNFEGMEMATEMTKKFFEDEQTTDQDEFMEADELVWTKAICPNTIFFRTATLLLKCRLYEWSELALSQEIHSHPGLVHYLLSAICYYKKLYVHALDHINETKKIYGPDYAVSSLAGHCFVALGKQKEAKEQYYWAMQFYNRPPSMHLTSIKLANILFEAGDDQEARKLALVACKYNPTPFTWLLAGRFYHHQNDLLSAEECFSEGNAIDNRYAEIWGYLALVNAELKRPSEAEICYIQAIRNKLDNEELLKNIQNAINSISKDNSLHVF